MRSSYPFTSESVSEGHPDKVCDRISDEIVDLFFREGAREDGDPWTIRAACETLGMPNKVVIAGETRGPSSVTKQRIEQVARAAAYGHFLAGRRRVTAASPGKGPIWSMRSGARHELAGT
jgi:S-adenosylmethionine synthetase